MTRITSCIVALATVIAMSAAAGAEDRANDQANAQTEDYQARLQAGKEAAYRMYLLRPSAAASEGAAAIYAGGSSSTGGSGAALRASGTIARPSFTVSAGHAQGGTSHITLHAGAQASVTSLARFNYNYNYRTPLSKATPGSLIFHSNYDPRDRRSWPRPVQTRTWVPSHWTFDGSRYHYVRGQVRYETRWVTVGRDRWHYNGSHYSVVTSFR
ncbi:MAG: hypothetical protein WD768_02725 [Phycisphaeraceae bacterium]